MIWMMVSRLRSCARVPRYRFSVVSRSLLLMGVLYSSAAGAMQVAMPLVCHILGSDAVLVAEVVDEGVKHERSIHLPGSERPLHGWFHDTQIRVEKVLYTSSKVPAIVVDASIPLTVWAKKPAPPRKPGQFGAVIADGPSYPELHQGERYLFLLKKLVGEPGYVAQPTSACTRRLDDSESSREWRMQVETAADVDRWSWGSPVDGLQVAFVPDATELTVYASALHGKVSAGRVRRLLFASVLRNVSERPITVNLYPQDKTLALLDHGVPVAAYASRRLLEEPFNISRHLYELQPGELLSIARYGKAPYGDHVEPEATLASRAYGVRYTSSRPGAWQGVVESGVVNMDVNVVER